MALLSGVSSNLQALSLEVSRKFSMTSVPSSLCSAERVHIPGVAISKTLRPALACLSKSPCHINKFSRAIFPQRLNKLSKFRCDAAISSPNNVIREGGLDTLDFPGESDTEDFSPSGYEFETEAAQDDEILEISKLGLDSSIVDSLSQRGISSLFPIQRAVFVPAMEGRDIIGRAKTGTGKTLAFGIPIIQRIIEENTSQGRRQSRKLPRVLVLAPTRELAKQVEKEFKESAPYLSTVCIYGGVSYTSQQSALSRGVDIVVGTPGRIIDLVEGRSLVLSEVKFLVLDEADQMLAVGFEEPVEVILEKLPEQRQSMLFSATMPGWVKKLARKHLNDPLTIDLVGESDEKLAEGIKLYAVSSAQSTASKRSILGDLITVYAKGGKSIVFTRTKRDADDVSMALSKEITCEALHGDISQYQRERTLAKFREGKFSTLVATDVAARGLDIPNVDLVVHYELPTDSETFVHRSGRTGRAGKEGVAILMHTIREKRKLKILEKEVNCRFEYVQPPQPKEVLDSSTHHVAKSLEGVHPELIEMFLPAAEKLLEGDPRNAMAAALACLSGFSQPPSSRSLLTLEKGWMTLQIVKDPSELMGGRKFTPRDVRGVLSSIWPTAADQVGKICIIDDRKVEGAVFDLPEDVAKDFLNVFDLPEDVAKDFLKKDILPGYEVYAASKLPELEEEDSLFPSRGGSFSSRGGSYSSRGGSFSSRGGSFSSRGGSFRGSRGRGAGRSSNGWNRSFEDDSYGDGDNDWFGGRKSRQSDDNDWFGGRRSRQSDDNDWFGGRKSREGGSDFSGGRRSSRSPFGSSSDGNFRGTCYKCGQSGHRASDCPSS